MAAGPSQCQERWNGGGQAETLCEEVAGVGVEQGAGVWNWGAAWLQFAACEEGKEVIPGLWRCGGLQWRYYRRWESPFCQLTPSLAMVDLAEPQAAGAQRALEH